MPVRTHMLTAIWSLLDIKDEPDWDDLPIDVSKLTIDEQADLIVKKLSTPPKPKLFNEFKILELLAKSMSDEIDAEILKGLK